MRRCRRKRRRSRRGTRLQRHAWRRRNARSCFVLAPAETGDSLCINVCKHLDLRIYIRSYRCYRCIQHGKHTLTHMCSCAHTHTYKRMTTCKSNSIKELTRTSQTPTTTTRISISICQPAQVITENHVYIVKHEMLHV